MDTLEEAIRSAAPIVGKRFDREAMEEFHLSQLEFRACRFTECNFDEARITASVFIGCVFDHCSFREATISDCQFTEGDTGTDWRYCDLSKAEFARSNLSLNGMTGCRAYLVSFLECAAAGAKFDLDSQRKIRTQSIGGGASFRKCKLQYAEFSPGDLSDSIFESSDLRDCCLAGCMLKGASFRGSSLNNIDLSGATLDDADLSHATFDRLDISAMASFHAARVTRDQHEALLSSIGLLTTD